jgi:glycosyltransferase involved in cell wall biosynthesis
VTQRPEPTVTVAICVRDGEKYLAEAINSARRQSHPPIQILVIDDRSTDTSSEIATALGCDLFRQRAGGLGAGRNIAFAQAKGDYVFFLDSDDVMPESSLRDLVHALNTTPEAVGAFGFRQTFISPELSPTAPTAGENHLERNRGPLSSGGLWSKNLGARFSFNEESPVADVEWGLDLRDSGLIFAESNETVMLRRVHLNNLSGREEVRKEYLALALRRRKNAVEN